MEDKEQEMHENLERGLKNRHIQLIGLGGAIGVGLFLGSATAIELAGPSVLLTYVIGGIAIYFIMRALGELSSPTRSPGPSVRMRHVSQARSGAISPAGRTGTCGWSPVWPSSLLSGYT